MEMLETKKATKTEFYFQKIQTLFLLVVQPKWKGKKKLKSKRASQSYIQQQSAQRESQSRWYKRKKQIANLATPKDLID
jgi:hypothetical protein